MYMKFTEGSLGNLDPRLVVQRDERACLSACLLSQTDPALGLDEQYITEVLALDGLYDQVEGTGLYPAKALDLSVRRIGLTASAVFEARGLTYAEEPRIRERINKVQSALAENKAVVVAFPKRRPNEVPFLHYALVTGSVGTSSEDVVAVMDPSEVDGGVFYPTWREFEAYVTPETGVPVMAWGFSSAQEDSPKVHSRRRADIGRACTKLLTEPLYREEDTGKAIPPETLHASSVVLPTTASTRDYYQYGDIILSRDGEYPYGYPRFVIPPAVRTLSAAVTGRLNSLPFPTIRAAQAAAYYEDTRGIHTPIAEAAGLFWLPDTKFNMEAWQQTGLGISSRQATAIIEGRPENNLERRALAQKEIKNTIELFTDAKPEDIYLFPTGMAAIYWLNQALMKLSNGAPTIQFGFPYVDTYEQRRFGPEKIASKNMIDLRDYNYEKLQDLVSLGQRFRAVMTEYPANPLLQTPDFERLDEIVSSSVPIIIDDTVGTMFNLDDKKLPAGVAARVTSLTKFFSAAGDVMGGSIILRPESPHYEALKGALGQLHEDTTWYEDAEALASNSRQFTCVMSIVNQVGHELASWLGDEWTGRPRALHAVHHPSLTDRGVYDKFKKNEGGYGGLMSLRFNDPDRAYRFFDALKITKGPSLGTLYSLGCLYTLLAHKPHGAVERFGVTPDLVRISVGIESVDDLKGRFEEAFIQSRG